MQANHPVNVTRQRTANESLRSIEVARCASFIAWKGKLTHPGEIERHALNTFGIRHVRRATAHASLNVDAS